MISWSPIREYNFKKVQYLDMYLKSYYSLTDSLS